MTELLAVIGGVVTIGCVTAIVVLRRKDRRAAETELRAARRYRTEAGEDQTKP